MKRLIYATASVLLLITVIGMYSTTAFFSDDETSVDNTFQTGAVDLKVDSTAHYAGMVCAYSEQAQGYVWLDEDDDETNNPRPELLGEFCFGSWASTDLDATHVFFDYYDVKPGDEGENTISLTVEDNDAWACMYIGNTQDDDNTQTEPEADVDPDGPISGELAENLYFTTWLDQGNTLGWQCPVGEAGCEADPGEGDNLWQGANLEPLLFSNEQGPASDVLGGRMYALADANTSFGPLAGGVTHYLGVQWCLGAMSNNGSEIFCDGSAVGNEVQTDSFFADIEFYVEQARNNPEFSCESVEFELKAEIVGANLGGYPLPDPQTDCDVTVVDTQDLQAAIDGANANDTVCVDDGTYNEFTVNKPLTIAGLVNPETSAKIVPSGPGVTELALVTSSDVAITGLHFDGTGVDSTGSQMAGIQISPNGANIDSVFILYNIIENLTATNANAANKGVQWHDGASSGSPNVPYALTNSVIAHNVIRNIHSDNKGGYGFQSVGDMDNVVISHNTISDITGAWGAGVALDGHELESTSGVNIAFNHIVSNIVFDFSVQVEAKVDASGIAINKNNLEALLFGGSSGTPSPAVLNAEHNWWGTATPALGADVFTNPNTNVVDFDPAAPSAFALN